VLARRRCTFRRAIRGSTANRTRRARLQLVGLHRSGSRLGGSGYDLAVVASDKLGRLVSAGVLKELDYRLLPSSKNLDAELHAALARIDPGNAHAVGYHWGTTGIGYDMSKLKELAPDAPTDSWGLIYDPDVLARMAGCGVSVVDAPSEVIATALMALGKDPNDLSAESLSAAENLLLNVRPGLRKIDHLTQIEDLANGSQCLVMTWPADVLRARVRAQESGKTAALRYRQLGGDADDRRSLAIGSEHLSDSRDAGKARVAAYAHAGREPVGESRVDKIPYRAMSSDDAKQGSGAGEGEEPGPSWSTMVSKA
jgi:hypothetical protein